MCTVIFWHQAVPGVSTLFAFNRDEFLARPTRGFHRYAPWGEVFVVGGRDLVSGGTWFAIGPAVTAALTNHHGETPPGPGEKTRGDLVLMAATARSLDEARARLSREQGPAYGPFHLLVTDHHRALYVTNHAGPLRVDDVGPGRHVLANKGLNVTADPRTAEVKARLDAAPAALPAVLRTAKQALSGHGETGPCFHLGPYGTRMSGLYVRHQDGREHLEATPGPPGESTYRILDPATGAPR